MRQRSTHLSSSHLSDRLRTTFGCMTVPSRGSMPRSGDSGRFCLDFERFSPHRDMCITTRHADAPTAQLRVLVMPLYEYQCRACGHGFETLVRGSRAAGLPGLPLARHRATALVVWCRLGSTLARRPAGRAQRLHVQRRTYGIEITARSRNGSGITCKRTTGFACPSPRTEPLNAPEPAQQAPHQAQCLTLPASSLPLPGGATFAARDGCAT